jgi:hypothetical protein
MLRVGRAQVKHNHAARISARWKGEGEREKKPLTKEEEKELEEQFCPHICIERHDGPSCLDRSHSCTYAELSYLQRDGISRSS